MSRALYLLAGIGSAGLVFLVGCGDARDYANMGPRWESTFASLDKSNRVRVYAVLRKSGEESVFAQFSTPTGFTDPVQIHKYGGFQKDLRIDIASTRDWSRFYFEYDFPFRGKIEFKRLTGENYGSWIDIEPGKVTNPEEVRDYKYSVFAYANAKTGAVKTHDDFHSTEAERASGLLYRREQMPEVEKLDGIEVSFQPTVTEAQKIYPKKSKKNKYPPDERPMVEKISIAINGSEIAVTEMGEKSLFTADRPGIDQAIDRVGVLVKNNRVQTLSIFEQDTASENNIERFCEAVGAMCAKDGEIYFSREHSKDKNQDRGNGP